MNIYEMYISNNNKAGFYVVRNSWGATYAQIIKVQGKISGNLAGKHPYYGNPTVLMNVYDFPSEKLKQKFQNVSCPGTGGYSMFKTEKDVLRYFKERRSSRFI